MLDFFAIVWNNMRFDVLMYCYRIVNQMTVVT